MIIGGFCAASTVSGIIEKDLEIRNILITQILHKFLGGPGGCTVLFAFRTKVKMMNMNIKVLNKAKKGYQILYWIHTCWCNYNKCNEFMPIIIKTQNTHNYVSEFS